MSQRPSILSGQVVSLAILTMFAPLSVDMYLPAFPTLVKALNTDAGNVQLTLSVFFVGFAVAQLVYGPLSDRFGRKLPLNVGIGLYIAASIGCALATSIEALIVLRFLQSLGACAGMVLARAMIRDLYGKDAAAHIMSTMIFITGAAPMLAPLIGGQVLAFTDWRGIFWVLTLFGVACLLVSTIRIPESLPPERRTSHNAWQMALSYGRLFLDRRFVGYALCAGTVFSGMFAYISGSPFIFIEIYGVSEQAYGLFFGFNVLGLIFGGIINSRLLPKLGSDRLLVLGTIWAMAAGVLLLFVTATSFGGLPLIALCCFLYMPAVNIVGSNAIAGALADYPHMAGTASALIGTTQFGTGALIGALVAVLHDGTAAPMGAAIAAMGTSAFVIRALLIRRPTP